MDAHCTPVQTKGKYADSIFDGMCTLKIDFNNLWRAFVAQTRTTFRSQKKNALSLHNETATFHNAYFDNNFMHDILVGEGVNNARFYHQSRAKF